MTKQYKYWRNCIGWPRGEVKYLIRMIDDANQITYATFIEKVYWKDIRAMWPDYKWRGGDGIVSYPMKDDYAVTFNSSKYRGETVYYIRCGTWRNPHSSIEYVFRKER